MRKMNKRSSRISNQLSNLKCFPNSKRSQGHIEMMLSFVLFLGAILFIFIYINPFAKTVEHSDELSSVQNIIMNHITANVGRLSVIVFAGNCYNFNPSDYSDPSNTFYVENEEKASGSKKQYTIYFGNNDVFAGTIPGHKLDGCAISDYRLGIFSNQTIISSKILAKLVSDAQPLLGYGDVKKSLGINSDFSINTTDLNRNSIPELSFSRNIPGTVEVESREFPIVAINASGQSNELILNIKVW